MTGGMTEVAVHVTALLVTRAEIYATLFYATADEADAFMFYGCFFWIF